jgi:hypothetical protein
MTMLMSALFLLFRSQIIGMDLFSPKKDQNDYGARDKKKVSLV